MERRYGEGMRKKTTAVMIAAFAALALLPSLAGATSDFGIVNAAWGTSGAPVSPAPGQYGVPLTITVQNLMCQPIKDVQFTLSTLGTGFTMSGGGGSSTQTVSTVAAGQQFSYTFYLNVPSGAVQGAYPMSGRLTYYYPVSVNNNCTASSSVAYNQYTPADYYSIPVYFSGNAVLSYRQGPAQVIPGGTENVTLLVTNTGSGNATQLQAVVSLPQGSRASVVSQPDTADLIAPGATAKLDFELSLPANLSGSSLPINITSSFLNGGSVYQVQRTPLSLSVSSRAPIVIVQNQTVAGVGGTTQLSIGIRNNADYPITYVQASLGQQTRLGLATNSTSTVTVTKGNPGYFDSIAPGQTVWFAPSVTTSPSVSEGGYNMVLLLSYMAPGNVSQSAGYTIGVVVAPRVNVVLQGVSASPLGLNSTGVQVSGNLLDMGSGNAYYSEVYAYLLVNGTVVGSNSTYVGEVLSDSPAAFSVTLSQQPSLAQRGSQAAQSGGTPASGNAVVSQRQDMQVELYAVYYDDLGDQFRSNSSTYGVGSGSFLGPGTPSGAFVVNGNTYRSIRGGTDYASVAVAVVIVALIGAAGFYLYKRRSKKGRRKERQVT